MANFIKKFARTLQVNFPFLQDMKFGFKRAYAQAFNVPAETDFAGLPLINGVNAMVFIDAGANRGETIQAIKLGARNAKIIGFEPNPIVFKKLQGVYGKDPNVTLHNVGLGDEEGNLELNIPYYKNFMFDGLASFKPEEALGWLRTRIFFFKESHLSLRKVNCHIDRLDSFNLSPDFIKIDVQGYELKVIIGGRKTIERTKPIFLIETPTEEVTRYLADLNYAPYRYDKETGFSPGQGSLNTFFFESSRRKSLIGM
jgi:FkbM family methyltransferase